MAGIDYTIPQQLKGIQIESPVNAMANAMQLRQLQESSELNALRRQDAQEAAQLRREELQFRTQEAKTKQEERQRALSKEQLVEAVADLTSYDTVASVLAGIKQKVAAGQVTQAQADKVIAGLPKNDFELPAWQIRTMRSLLPAKEQYAELKAARDAAYEDYATSETFAGRSPLPRQDWERRTAPAAAPTAAPTVAPTAEAAPITAPTPTSTQGFMPVELGVPYDVYVKNAIVGNQERVLGRDAYEAEQQRLAQMGQPAPANALAANVAPANALVSPPVAVDVQAGAEKALPSVAVQGKRVGFDYLDPQAQALYELAAKTKDKEKAATYRATAKEIQDAHVAALKERQLTGDFLNVVNAEKQIAELEKQPQTPEIKRLVATLRAQIKGTTQGKGTNVNVGVKLPPQEQEFEKEIGSGQAKDIIASKTKAEDARDILETARQGRAMLKGPIITGAGANFFVGLDQALKTAGMDFGGEASANAQAYGVLMASNTAKLIKNFGAGTGLSDADRKYAERMAAGDITVDRRALEKILQIQETAATRAIERHNQKVKGIKTKIPLEVNIEQPEPAASNLSPTDKQALDWANANPKDPRAAQIKQRLGVK